MPFRQLMIHSARDTRGRGKCGGSQEHCVKKVEVELHGDGSGGLKVGSCGKDSCEKISLLLKVDSSRL